MGTHSRFSPSSTEREFSCPPSFLLNEALPDRSSADAEHGTAAHHIGEICLRLDHDTSLYAGCTVAVKPENGECRFVHEKAPLREDEHAYLVDDEMVNAVQSYVDWCRELPGDHFVEVRVEHTKWCPDFDEWGDRLGPQFGTSDSVCIGAKVIDVTDLKYGKGVKVYAEENKQAIKYALGVVEEYAWQYGIDDTWKVRIRICQPRLDHFDVWEVTVAELLDWGQRIKDRLELVFDPGAEFNPGPKQCRFCKAAARCKARLEYLQAGRGFKFEDERGSYDDPRLLTSEEMASIWQRAPDVRSYLEQVEAELGAKMRGGEQPAGLKLVAAKTHRRWRDEGEARAALLKLGVPSTAIEKRTLVSPNQAEQLLTAERRKELESHWAKPPGGPVIALSTDKRDPYPVDGGFDDETFDDGFD